MPLIVKCWMLIHIQYLYKGYLCRWFIFMDSVFLMAVFFELFFEFKYRYLNKFNYRLNPFWEPVEVDIEHLEHLNTKP